MCEIIQRSIFDPWTVQFSESLMIVLMGFFVAAACGVLGIFIILRRMSMIGDAMSHCLLLGIGLAYLLQGYRSSVGMFIGAVVVSVGVVYLIDYLKRSVRLKSDAAIGVVYTVCFALGILLITLFADSVDLDTDCVLYGEIAFIPLHPSLNWLGLNWGPKILFQAGLFAVIVLLLVRLFFKELLISIFDANLAKCMGIKIVIIHLSLMCMLSLTLVNSFEAVGAIMVIGMLLFPGATAMLIAKRLGKVMGYSILFAFLYALWGYHLAILMNSSIASGMLTVAMIIFFIIARSQGFKKRLFYSKRIVS